MERENLLEEMTEMASATEIAVQLAKELERKTLLHELLLKIERGATIDEIKAYLENCDGMTDYQFKRFMELKDKCAAQEQQLNALKNAPTGTKRGTTPNELRLPALDACVTIDNDTVTVKSNNGENIQLSLREWEELRESLRFDGCVDYERGETPMTVYQLQIFINLTREIKDLTKQISHSS